MQNGFQNENVTYVMIQKVPSPNLVMNDLMFTLADKSELKSLFDESNIIGTLYNDGIAQTILDNGSDGVIQGYTNVSLTQVNEFGLSLVGRLPVDHSLTTEVVITNYIAYQMGWLNESNYHDDTVLQSIIDTRTLDINFIDGNDLHKYTFTIVGIIDTNYKLPDQTIENSTYQFMYENDLKFGLHSTLFFGIDMVNFITELDQNIGNYGADKVAYQLFVTVKDGGYRRALEYQKIMGESNVWVNSKLDYSLHMIKEFKNVVLQVSLVLGIVFLLTSLISFVGFIHNMVVNKETSIRIMRSLGTRFKDMNFIFLIQDAFLAIFTTGLSTITALIAGHFINQSIATNIYVIIPLVNPTVWIPMVILIITFCFAYLITFTELKRTYSKTKVIE
jgi:ABC-type antimicrobial peptide transport system permease subunit